tara:strand:- start:200 stop:391 length:192 start_codon:yes stop_codon:yes gene_type:complete
MYIYQLVMLNRIKFFCKPGVVAVEPQARMEVGAQEEVVAGLSTWVKLLPLQVAVTVAHLITLP